MATLTVHLWRFVRRLLPDNWSNYAAGVVLRHSYAPPRHSRAGGNPAYKARVSRSFIAAQAKGRPPNDPCCRLSPPSRKCARSALYLRWIPAPVQARGKPAREWRGKGARDCGGRRQREFLAARRSHDPLFPQGFCTAWKAGIQLKRGAERAHSDKSPYKSPDKSPHKSETKPGPNHQAVQPSAQSAMISPPGFPESPPRRLRRSRG